MVVGQRGLLPYGVYHEPSQQLYYIGLHDNEADCWKVYLGWPDEEEIEAAKAHGLRVRMLRVEFPCDACTPRVAVL